MDLRLNFIGYVATAIAPEISSILRRHLVEACCDSPDNEMHARDRIADVACDGVGLVGGLDGANVGDKRDDVQPEGNDGDAEQHVCGP